MKSPIQRRAAIAALLLVPALTACGFNAQTDQVYQPGVGVNDRSGSVDILNAVVVSQSDGSGTFAGTLVNKGQEDDVLDSVSGPGITASSDTVTVKAGVPTLLAKTGQVTLQGSGIRPGSYVDLTFDFGSGQSTTMKVPVVSAGGDYADVPMPGESSSSPSKAPKSSKSPKSSPSESPSASPSASPSGQ